MNQGKIEVTLNTTFSHLCTDWPGNYEWMQRLQEHCEPLVQQYYQPYYYIWHDQPNKLEIAFKIVHKMIEKQMMTIETVQEFIEAVNEVAKLV